MSGPTTTVAPPAPGADEAVPLAALVDVAVGVAASPLWADHAHHDPSGRRPVRLIGTDHYEVWVIGWTPGQAVELHDHGGSVGVLAVVEGELTEVERVDGELVIRGLGAGEVRPMAADVVHEVLNLSDGPATSIHVYSPPLRTMGFYGADPDAGPGVEEVRSVEEEPAVLDGRGAAGALHPSRGRRP